ncbi:unnamed protein product [Mytilus coruscus]|uniref:Uncharacterized protein n=1 Tax=Mytilus coruscus TaxID=42192 RepID=A0A6J8CFR5_MYTCO|nr:unnamed protein product [Mytilus coruscus]
MQRDATTKQGRHFVGLELSTGDKILTAGLREVENGKAITYVDYTKEIIKDIEDTTETHDKILPKISSFMTDRSVTEQKANLLISNDGNKNTIAHYFKCAVHPLLQYRDVCTKQIVQLEKNFNIKVDGCSNMSASSFLLNCVSKLIFKDGTGDPELATTYIKSLNITRIPIMKLRGNQFNYLFYNAAGTYILHKHVITYLKASKSSLNFIQDYIVQYNDKEGNINKSDLTTEEIQTDYTAKIINETDYTE